VICSTKYLLSPDMKKEIVQIVLFYKFFIDC
jgi:hypothetical protein